MDTDKPKTSVTSQFTLGMKVLHLVFAASPRFTSLYLLSNIFNSLVPTMTLYAGKLVLDAVVAAIGNPSPSHINQVVIASLLLAGSRILNTVFNGATSYFFSRLRDIFTPFVMLKVYTQAASLDLSFFDDPKFYDKLEKVQREVGYRPVEAMDNVIDIIASTLGGLSLILILFKLSPFAPLILLVAAVPNLIYRFRFSWRTYLITDNRSPQNRKVWQINYWLTSKNSAKEVKVFGIKDYLLDIFNKINNEFINENKKLYFLKELYQFLLGCLSTGVQLVLTLYAALQTISQHLTIGDLGMISGAINEFQTTLQDLFRFASRFYEHNLFLSHYFEFMDLKPKIDIVSGQQILEKGGRMSIEFRHVYFGYSEDKPILKDISFKIDDAKNFALVGENGAGKTTLIKLLLRLYQPTKGDIFVNDINVKDVSIESLHDNFSVIFQDFAQYDLSARENIGLGDVKNIGDLKKVKEAAKLSGASEFIEAFPEQYDTLLGRHWEKGEELSGGQWQKIAIARAFFKDARAIIMDEPTSALDPKSEYEVFKNLITHTKDKSLILISHRFSTVRLADQIIVLHKGEIAEQGSHEELITLGGRYAKLYDLQAKWYK